MSTKYEIGGVGVSMTDAQAKRWNAGRASHYDLRTVQVAIPEPENQSRYVSLRRAINATLEPEVSQMLYGMPANRTA